MSDRDVTTTVGGGSAVLTTQGGQNPTRVNIRHCDKRVPRAGDEIYGKCNYYYEPMMFGQIEAIRQSWPEGTEAPSFPSQDGVGKSGISTGEVIGQWVENRFVPLPLTACDNLEMMRRALRWHDQLINPETNEGWSRYGNFWARHVGCGHVPPDYYTKYGYYYCSRYAEYLYPRLSPRGKQWMVDARYNLQVYLDDALEMNMAPSASSIEIPQTRSVSKTIDVAPYELELESGVFKQAAFATHVKAYLDAGLGDLSALDLYKIGTMPNIEEWGDSATWEQARKSAGSAWSDLRSGDSEMISNTWSDVHERTSRLLDDAIERLASWF